MEMEISTILDEAAGLVIVFVAAALSLGALTVCGLIAYFAMREARHALDVVVRHQDDAASYYRRAIAESVAKGKADLVVKVPQDEGGGQGGLASEALERARREAAEDLAEVEGD